MPLFSLSEEGWFGPPSFTIHDENEDEVLCIESDSYWHDDFAAYNPVSNSRVAYIQDTTAVCGPYAYEILSSTKRICATLTHMLACCSESFELDVHDEDKTRAYYFDRTSLLSREWSLSRHGEAVATYSTAWLGPWWGPSEIDIDDEYVGARDKDFAAIILFACVIIERICHRKTQQQTHQANQAALGIP